MARSIVTAVALFISFVAGGWLLNGVGTRAAEDPKPPPKARGQLYQHWKELGLTKDQVQRIYQLQADYRAKIDELERKAKELRREERAKAEEILTPAQKARLKEILLGTAEPPKDKVTPPKDK